MPTPQEDISLLVKSSDWPTLRAYFHNRFNDSSLPAQDKAELAILWGRLFLPEYLRDSSPPFHRTLFTDFFSPKNEYSAYPRGFGKTTMEQLFLCVSVAHRLHRFIVVVEKTFTEAAEVLDVPRREFSDNALIKAVYGSLVSLRSDDAPADLKGGDAEGDIFINAVRLRGKGFNAPIRGLKSAAYRPDLIILDDVESDEHIRNEEQRRKYMDNFVAGILPALDVRSALKVQGTILHHDSLLANLIEKFGGKIYGAYNPDLPTEEEQKASLLWPERWSWELLMEKKRQMEIEGLGSSKFYQEYLNRCVDEARKAFPERWLSCYFEEHELNRLTLFRSVSIDVAESKNQGADDTGVTIVDTDRENNWYVRHVKRHKVNSAELLELIFDIHGAYHPAVIGVEKRALEDQVMPFIRTMSEKRGVFPHVVELKHHGKSKEDRVLGALQGRFESGKILFRSEATDDTNVLKGQLRDFPYGKKDDLCLSGDTLVQTFFGIKRLEDIRSGDYVLTPVGFRKVLAHALTGIKETSVFFGVRATEGHPFFLNNSFVPIDILHYQEYNTLVCQTLFTQIRWGVQNLWSSMDVSSGSWEGKESITFLNAQIIREGSLLKGFMSRFLNFIQDKKFLKASMFTIRTVIRLITILTTWNVFHVLNTINSLRKLMLRKIKGIWIKSDISLKNGTLPQKAVNGMQKMEKNFGERNKKINPAFAGFAEKHFCPFSRVLFIALDTTLTYIVKVLEKILSQGHALPAEKFLMLTNIGKKDFAHPIVPLDTRVEKVYNITVDGVNCFFANRILVGNCDSLAYHSQLSKPPGGRASVGSIMPSAFREFFEMKKKARKSITSKL